jgi:serine/threonine-protein phosphatase 2B catalytic subunit
MADEVANSKDYIDNEERECSYLFGKKPAKKLLDSNNLMSILRGHQVQIEGYKMHRWDGPASFPYVITIFSAPNYCGYYENKASVLIIDRGNLSLKQYDESEPPYKLPDNMDVFSWSMPFLAEKITQMLVTVVTKYDDGDEGQALPTNIGDMTGMTEEEIRKKKAQVIGKKVKTIARMSKMFSTLREESETLLKLKNMSPDGKLPRGLLMDGKPAIRNALKQFNLARELDKVNEKRPK